MPSLSGNDTAVRWWTSVLPYSVISAQPARRQAGTGWPADEREMQRSTCRTETLQDYTQHHTCTHNVSIHVSESEESNVTALFCHGHYRLNKKLIRRWDSERELSLRRHRTRTTKYNRLVHKFHHRSMQRLCAGTYVYQIQWNNTMQQPLRHSMSPILVPIESSHTTSY